MPALQIHPEGEWSLPCVSRAFVLPDVWDRYCSRIREGSSDLRHAGRIGGLFPHFCSAEVRSMEVGRRILHLLEVPKATDDEATKAGGKTGTDQAEEGGLSHQHELGHIASSFQ